MPRKKPSNDLPPVQRVCVRMGADGHAYRVPTPPSEPPRQVDAFGQPRVTVICDCGVATYMLTGGGLAPHDGHVAFDPGPSTAFNCPPRSPEAEAQLQALIAAASKPKANARPTPPETDPAPPPDRAVGLEPSPEPTPPPPEPATPPLSKPQVASSAPDAEPEHVFEPELGDPEDPYLG